MRHVFGVVLQPMGPRAAEFKKRTLHIYMRHDYIHIFFKSLFDHLGDLCHQDASALISN